MFRFDTLATLRLLAEFPLLQSVVFEHGLWLKPTLEGV